MSEDIAINSARFPIIATECVSTCLRFNVTFNPQYSCGLLVWIACNSNILRVTFSNCDTALDLL